MSAAVISTATMNSSRAINRVVALFFAMVVYSVDNLQ